MTDDELNVATPAELVAEIFKLRAALKGPENFPTWQAAAVDERQRRVDAEKKLQDLQDYLSGIVT